MDAFGAGAVDMEVGGGIDDVGGEDADGVDVEVVVLDVVVAPLDGELVYGVG